MADLFIKGIPLPVPRPSGLYLESEPSTYAGMPLESPRKAVDAFLEGGSYPTSGQGTKLTSELLMAFKGIMTKIGSEASRIFDAIGEFGNMYATNIYDFAAAAEGWFQWAAVVSVIAAVGILIWMGIAWVIRKICGN